VGDDSHGSPEANLRGDTVMARTRPTSGRRRSHGSLEANLEREMQRLAQGQPRLGDTVKVA
jgi:hypothetical protein